MRGIIIKGLDMPRTRKRLEILPDGRIVEGDRKGLVISDKFQAIEIDDEIYKKTEEETRWVPADYPPLIHNMCGDDYLVYTKYDNYALATYYPSGDWLGFDNMGDSVETEEVIAWMPLPKPWKGE